MGQYVVVVLLKLGPTTTRMSAFLVKGCRVEHQKAVLRPISASLRYLRGFNLRQEQEMQSHSKL